MAGRRKPRQLRAVVAEGRCAWNGRGGLRQAPSRLGRRPAAPEVEEQGLRILCIASGGGHLEQMLTYLDALQGHEIVLAHYAFPNFRDFEDSRLAEHVGIFRGGEGGFGC